ncbi:biotin-dependent carboxyltransferase family protein [Ruminococcaceae bacterium OttesenSCG-928-A11]|nr:biotin-dependent carboxyltransferase family protein [Ruminococcaceae bacterium OttesenSCG-928-A11]
MSGITIVTPGPQTTVQDLGRVGWQHIGMGPAGAMDAVSAQIANGLVGNAPGAAVLEAALHGPALTFDATAVAAITGGTVRATLNGAPVPMWRSFRVKAGDTLALGPVAAGLRVYLAFSGGITVPPVMGSWATNLAAATGGLGGHALKAGDCLPLGETPGRNVAQMRELPVSDLPPYLRGLQAPHTPKTITLRVVPGPQQDAFTRRGRHCFYESTYTLTGQSDRMGYRFDGPAIEAKNGTDILSDGTATGSVQVAGSGLPMLLMADRQTTGGYAKIATVITADLPAAAQLRPGDAVRFEAVPVGAAQALLRRQAEWLAGLAGRLVPIEEPPSQGGVWHFTAQSETGQTFTGTVRPR